MPLAGYGLSYDRQIVYYLRLPPNENIDSRFQVGFYNDPPTITNATIATNSIFSIGVETGKIVDINPNILISLRWAPN